MAYKTKINVEKNRNGSYVISDGEFKEVYYGYSKTEAIKRYRNKRKELKNKK